MILTDCHQLNIRKFHKRARDGDRQTERDGDRRTDNFVHSRLSNASFPNIFSGRGVLNVYTTLICIRLLICQWECTRQRKMCYFFVIIYLCYTRLNVESSVQNLGLPIVDLYNTSYIGQHSYIWPMAVTFYLKMCTVEKWPRFLWPPGIFVFMQTAELERLTRRGHYWRCADKTDTALFCVVVYRRRALFDTAHLQTLSKIERWIQ